MISRPTIYNLKLLHLNSSKTPFSSLGDRVEELAEFFELPDV